ncbi:hypothetical protein C8R45DRAFT_1110052 [Mycena sanguinolenta]|nr:hypothetical protein C8R45DRAFT_1110052 [Mycena sanguinolenta]
MSQPQHIHYADQVVMDERPGSRRWYLVSRGRLVGIFDEWLEVKASVSGFKDNSYRAYNTLDECVDAWQALCRWGLHAHPVDPAFAQGAPTEVTSAVPQVPPSASTSAAGKTAVKEPVARERGETVPSSSKGHDLKWLLTRSAGSSPEKQKSSSAPSPQKKHALGSGLNFAIRGQGVVSSSAERTERRYLELRAQGEEPDLLLTRSLEAASFFVLHEED